MANSSASQLSDSQISPSFLTEDEQGLILERLPDLTVREYLKKIEADMEQRIMDRARAHNAKLLEEYERGKNSVLQEVKKMKVAGYTAAATKLQPRIIVLDATGKDFQKRIELKVGGERDLTAKVGRSRGKEFLEKGISLHWDNEVSTTHGRFLVRNDEVLFEDLGSTNKTLLFCSSKQDMITLTGKEEGKESSALQKGDVIHVGQCKLKVIEIRSME